MYEFIILITKAYNFLTSKKINMKKKILIIMALSLAIVGCSKVSEQQPIVTPKDKIDLAQFASVAATDYGYWHNYALDVTDSIWWVDTTIGIDSVANAMRIKLSAANSDFSGVTKQDLDNMLNSTLMQSYLGHIGDDEVTFCNYVRGKLTEIYNEETISEDLYDGLYDVMDPYKTYSQRVSAMSNINTASLSTDEANLVIAMKSVLTSSNQYWIDFEQSINGTGRQLTKPGMGKLVDFVALGFAAFSTGGFGLIGGLFISAACSSAWSDT